MPRVLKGQDVTNPVIVSFDGEGDYKVYRTEKSVVVHCCARHPMKPEKAMAVGEALTKLTKAYIKKNCTSKDEDGYDEFPSHVLLDSKPRLIVAVNEDDYYDGGGKPTYLLYLTLGKDFQYLIQK